VNVRSSNVASVNHDGEILTVTYHSGRTYRYFDVKRSLYEALVMSRSKGRFLQKWIIGKKQATEVTPDRKS